MADHFHPRPMCGGKKHDATCFGKGPEVACGGRSEDKLLRCRHKKVVQKAAKKRKIAKKKK